MSCQAFAEALSALVDGELEAGEEAGVRAHMEGCAACRGRFDALDRAAGAIGALETPGPRADFLERLDRRLEAELEADGFVPVSRSRRLSAARAPRSHAALFLRLAAAAVFALGGYSLYRAWTAPAPREEPRVARGPAGVPAGGTPRGGGSSGDGAARGRADAPAIPAVPADPARPERSHAPELAEGPGEVEGPARASTPGPLAGARAPSAPRERGTERSPPAAAPGSDGAPAGGPEEAEPPEAAGAPRPAAPLDPRERAARARGHVAVARAARAPLERRAEAVFELAKLGGPEAAEFFREALLGRAAALAPLADEAMRALGSYPDRDTLPVLVAAAEERPVEGRAALERVDDEDLLGWLAREVLPALGERERPAARLILAETLGRKRAPGADAAIADACARTRDVARRARLLLALAEAGEPESPRAVKTLLVQAGLVGGERQPDAVRAAAVRGLGIVRASEPEERHVARRLRELLRADPSALVRAAAASALGRFNDAETLDALLAAREGDRSGRVRGAALIALQRASGEGLFAADEWRAWQAGRASSAGGAPAALPAPLHPNAIVLSEHPHPQTHHGIPVVADGAVFLLDISSSMRHDGKLERAREELVRTLRALPPGTPFQVGMFAETAEFYFRGGLARAGAETVGQACEWIERRDVRQGGATDFEAALRGALAHRDADQVFLVTDGAPTEGKAAGRLVEEIRSATAAGEVRIHALGLYRKHGPFRIDQPDLKSAPHVEFLRALARASGGVFVRND